jgi:uncharacterized membrane protein
MNRVAPWRFLLFFGVLVVGWTVGLLVLERTQAVLVGFDAAAAGFLISCIPTLWHAPAEMRGLSERSDANRAVLLFIVAVLTVVVFAAIIGELGPRGALDPADKLLVAISLALAWTFGNAVYALHYAHLFYRHDDAGNDHGGLIFPGTDEPLMSDFAYFSFTLGVAVQTSDVQVTSRRIRNVVTVHSVIGFFFNLGVLSLTINLLASG